MSGVHPDIASFRDLAHAFDLKASAVAARATLEAALERRESRGCHNRSDYPLIDPTLQVNLVWSGPGQLAREPVPPIPDRDLAADDRGVVRRQARRVVGLQDRPTGTQPRSSIQLRRGQGLCQHGARRATPEMVFNATVGRCHDDDHPHGLTTFALCASVGAPGRRSRPGSTSALTSVAATDCHRSQARPVFDAPTEERGHRR